MSSTRMFNARLDDGEYAMLADRARAEGVTLTELVRRWIKAPPGMGHAHDACDRRIADLEADNARLRDEIDAPF